MSPELLRVHAGDLHVAAARGSRRSRTRSRRGGPEQRRREEQREALDAHADGLGRGEVAELVQDDQGADAEERQDPAHRPSLAGRLTGPGGNRAPAAGASGTLGGRAPVRRSARQQPRDGVAGELPGAPVGLVQRLEGADRFAVELLERLLDHLGDLEEAKAPVEEGVDGDLVGGVEDARRGSARGGRPARPGAGRGRPRGRPARRSARPTCARSSGATGSSTLSPPWSA